MIFVGKPGTCRNHPFTRPYDAKNYPLTSPIVYLEGAEDAHTPAWQSSYHFNSQTQAARVMVSVADEYHLPMQQEFGRICGAEVMKAILETPRSELAGAVRAAASKCPLKTTVRSEPGQVQDAWPVEMESSGPAQGDSGALR